MEMQSRASNFFSREARPLLGLLVFFIFSSSSVGQIISISCPTTFTDGYIENIDCLIDSTTIEQSGCSLSASVDFFFSKDSVTTPLCQTPYNGPVSYDVLGDMNCGMVSSISGKRKFQLNFLGNRNFHQGGKLSCSITCSTDSSSSCGPLAFEIESSCTGGCVAGIVIAVLVLIAVGGVVAKKQTQVRVTTMVDVSTEDKEHLLQCLTHVDIRTKYLKPDPQRVDIRTKYLTPDTQRVPADDAIAGKRDKKNIPPYKKPRKANWTNMKIWMLLEEVRMEKVCLMSSLTNEITNEKKTAIWQQIADKPTASRGVEHRSLVSVREKWGTLKSEAQRRRERKKTTGCGAVRDCEYDNIIFDILAKGPNVTDEIDDGRDMLSLRTITNYADMPSKTVTSDSVTC